MKAVGSNRGWEIEGKDRNTYQMAHVGLNTSIATLNF